MNLFSLFIIIKIYLQLQYYNSEAYCVLCEPHLNFLLYISNISKGHLLFVRFLCVEAEGKTVTERQKDIHLGSSEYNAEQIIEQVNFFLCGNDDGHNANDHFIYRIKRADGKKILTGLEYFEPNYEEEEPIKNTNELISSNDFYGTQFANSKEWIGSQEYFDYYKEPEDIKNIHEWIASKEYFDYYHQEPEQIKNTNELIVNQENSNYYKIPERITNRKNWIRSQEYFEPNYEEEEPIKNTNELIEKIEYYEDPEQIEKTKEWIGSQEYFDYYKEPEQIEWITSQEYEYGIERNEQYGYMI